MPLSISRDSNSGVTDVATKPPVPKRQFHQSTLAITLGLTLLLGIGAARIAPTYSLFTQTYDEPLHLACGMEWWDLGRYQYERKHPPLPRIAMAALPYLDGLHSYGNPYSEQGHMAEGNAIMYSRGTYQRNLTLARLGTLPFFIFATLVLWFWTRRVFGTLAAWLATLLFTTLPPILAHAGIAGCDMCTTACLGAALYTLTRWLKQPGWRQAAALGVSLGLAVLAQFSLVMFFPVSVFLLAVFYFVVQRPSVKALIREAWSRRRQVAAIALIAFFVMWAGYRFNLTPPMKQTGDSQRMIERAFGRTGFLHDTVSRIAEMPMPLGEVVAGLGAVWDLAMDGNPSYLLGSYSEKGRWYFYPVVLAVKTPLAFSALVLIGLALLIRRSGRNISWEEWAPACFAAGVLSVCMLGTVNGGVRYALPVYLMLSMIAGFAVAGLLRSFTGKLPAAIGVALLASALISSISAHPDYLPYFNILAGGHPENIVADHDLDWGQDLNRLSLKLKQVGAKEVTLSYFGSADVTKHGLPAIRPLVPYQPATGWVAISIYNLKLRALRIQKASGKSISPYAWLQQYQPTRVGKSIFLYFVPPPAARSSSAAQSSLAWSHQQTGPALLGHEINIHQIP